MSRRLPPSPAALLSEAAASASYAPSVLNTQPWSWVVGPQTLELHAERSRQLAAIDPQGRLLTMSCGAALYHARVSLAAEGWSSRIMRLPEPDKPDLLARISLGDHVGVTPEAMQTFQAIWLRRTDRRPVSDAPVPTRLITWIREAATACGIDAHLLREEQISELSVAAAHADAAELADPHQRAELAYWVGGERPLGSGLPDNAVLDGPLGTVVPGRDFLRSGTLQTTPGSDRAAAYLMLFGPADEPVDWLRAGEALGAAWLRATQVGVSMLPFSNVIEVPGTREALRHMLAGMGYPFIVLRLGRPDAEHAGPPHTPRLPIAQIIEIHLD